SAVSSRAWTAASLSDQSHTASALRACSLCEIFKSYLSTLRTARMTRAARRGLGVPSFVNITVDIEPLPILANEATGFVKAAGPAMEAAAGHELHQGMGVVLGDMSSYLQAQPLEPCRI